MPDRIFTLKEWQRIKKDIFDDYFDQLNINYDLKDLAKVEMLGENVPEGYHRMPDGSLMLDSEMPQVEGG